MEKLRERESFRDIQRQILYYVPSIVRAIRLKWIQHRARMENIKIAYRIVVGNLKLTTQVCKEDARILTSLIKLSILISSAFVSIDKAYTKISTDTVCCVRCISYRPQQCLWNWLFSHLQASILIGRFFITIYFALSGVILGRQNTRLLCNCCTSDLTMESGRNNFRIMNPLLSQTLGNNQISKSKNGFTGV